MKLEENCKGEETSDEMKGKGVGEKQKGMKDVEKK